MIYEISSISDMVSGTTLSISIPTEDLDKKALHTIQMDKPDFILPFRYRAIEGQAEFVYQVGNHNKLQYMAGERNSKEYTELWASAIAPLCDCGDWFMKPYSFILDVNHLYFDKNKNAVKYVYIPSMRDCCDNNELKKMLMDFSGKITVTDSSIENKILRAIMTDFSPKAFLQILKTCTAANLSVGKLPAVLEQHIYQKIEEPAISEQLTANQDVFSLPEHGGIPQKGEGDNLSDDIIISFPADSAPMERKRTSKKEKKASREKPREKPKANESEKDERREKDREMLRKSSENKLSLFNKKTLPQHEDTMRIENVASIDAKPPLPPHQESYQISMPSYLAVVEPDSTTQSISHDSDGAWLRLVGSPSLPALIVVLIEEGEVFTIGRYDAAKGRAQSSLEFDRMTKAVSRRHAAIERCAEGYNLIDLSSSAGTFLDGHKLPANTPCKLQSGCRISFGNCGADYVWEQ